MGRLTHIVTVSCMLVTAVAADARPRYALEEGVRCITCHINPTGAGKRTETGGQLFQRTLALPSTQRLAPEEFTGRLARWVGLGADFRVRNTTTLSSPVANTTTVPQGSLYVEVNAGQYVTGYIDQDFANTLNRETFVMFRRLDTRFWAKAGRMNLPYGLRITDTSSPIRANYNMTFANQDIALELGYAPGPFEFIAAVSNGVPGGAGDENLAKAVTTTAQWIGEHGRVGTSLHWNKRSNVRLLQGALHGGFGVGPITWLGEIDAQQSASRTGGGNTWVLAGYSELNWRINDGLYLKGVYDILDPDYQATNNVQHRVAAGIDLFPLPYTQLSLMYRMNIGSGAGSDQVLAGAHFYF